MTRDEMIIAVLAPPETFYTEYVSRCMVALDAYDAVLNGMMPHDEGGLYWWGKGPAPDSLCARLLACRGQFINADAAAKRFVGCRFDSSVWLRQVEPNGKVRWECQATHPRQTFALDPQGLDPDEYLTPRAMILALQAAGKPINHDMAENNRAVRKETPSA
jgi:hypothetical protein